MNNLISSFKVSNLFFVSLWIIIQLEHFPLPSKPSHIPFFVFCMMLIPCKLSGLTWTFGHWIRWKPLGWNYHLVCFYLRKMWLLFPAFLSIYSSLYRTETIWAFSNLLWHVCWYLPSLAHIWAVMYLHLYPAFNPCDSGSIISLHSPSNLLILAPGIFSMLIMLPKEFLIWWFAL